MDYQMSTPTTGSKKAGAIMLQVFERGIQEEERNNRYDQISQHYDESILESGYAGLTVIADTVASLYPPDKRSEVIMLDIGAGTGLVAEELQKHGFKTMDALDASSGMLQKAREKGIYRNLICETITAEPLDIPKDTYDVLTVLGSHGPNHIKGDAILEMIRLTKPDGYVCICTRKENFEKVVEYKDSFFPMCDKLESEGRWKNIKRDPCSYFPGVEGICICYQIC